MTSGRKRNLVKGGKRKRVGEVVWKWKKETVSEKDKSFSKKGYKPNHKKDP